MLKIILLTSAFLLTSVQSIASEEVGSFWRAKNTSVDNEKAKVGDVFKVDQLIETGKSSRSKAELSIKDSSRYILYKNSSIKFEEFKMAGTTCNGMKVTLTKGKIRGTSGSCGHGKTEIITTVATASAWGTDYEMMYLTEAIAVEGYADIAPGFYQKVNEGKVMVSNESGDLLINPGEAGFVSMLGAAPVIIPTPIFFTNTKKPIIKKKKTGKKSSSNPKEEVKDLTEVDIVEKVEEYVSAADLYTNQASSVITEVYEQDPELDTEKAFDYNETINTDTTYVYTAGNDNVVGEMTEQSTAYFSRDHYTDNTYTDTPLYTEKLTKVSGEDSWQPVANTTIIVPDETLPSSYSDFEIFSDNGFGMQEPTSTGIIQRPHYQKRQYTEQKQYDGIWTKIHLDANNEPTGEAFDNVSTSTLYSGSEATRDSTPTQGDFLFREFRGSETALGIYLDDAIAESTSANYTKIIGRYSSKFIYNPIPEGPSVAKPARTIYDDLFDPIKNQHQDIEVMLTLDGGTSQRRVLVVPKDNRNQYGSFVAVSPSFNGDPWLSITSGNPTSVPANAGTTSQFTEVVNDGGYAAANQAFAGQNYTLDGADDYRGGQDINQGSSTVYLGYMTDYGQTDKQMYIYENRAGTYGSGISDDDIAPMFLPKYGTINYEIADKTGILISKNGDTAYIDSAYELTDVELGINFNNNKVNTKLAISNGTDKVWSNNGVAIESDLEIDNRNNSPTGRFTSNNSTYNPYANITQTTDELVGQSSTLTPGYILFNGTTMGNKGSHVGLGYIMAYDAGTLASGTVLLKAESGSDRHLANKGSLIMLNTYDNETKMQAQTPSHSATPEAQADDQFEAIVDANNNTTKLTFCKASGCDASIVADINYIEPFSVGNELTTVINAGTMSESTVHWGWWGQMASSAPLNIAYNNTLFMYEDKAEYNELGMFLPTKGVIDYEVMESSQLLINAQTGTDFYNSPSYESTSLYELEDATLEIDFGLAEDNIKTSITIKNTDTDVSINSSLAVSSLNSLNGTFAVDGGYGFESGTTNSTRNVGIASGEFTAVGAMMGTNGSHAGMGYKMAVKAINDITATHDTVLGTILFRAKN